jgi:hypothetical protein
VAAVCFTPLVTRLVRPWPAPSSAVAIIVATTLALSVILAHYAICSERLTTLWCVMGGPCFGALNAGCSLALIGVADGQLEQALIALLLGSTLGIVYWGGPLGLVYGLAYLVPLRSAVEARQFPSYDGAASVLRKSGAWLVVLGLALVGWWVLFDSGIGKGDHVWERGSSVAQAYAAAGLPIVALLLGSAMWALGTLRRRARHRFVERVRQGHVPGWKVVPLDSYDDDPAMPLEPDPFWALDAVLIRARPRHDAYRVGADEVVVARLPAEGAR